MLTEPPFDSAQDLGLWRLQQLSGLLAAVDSEHTAKGEPKYRQTVWSHPCGTPACALGHWAAAHSERWVLRYQFNEQDYAPVQEAFLEDRKKPLRERRMQQWVPLWNDGKTRHANFYGAMAEFHITYREAEELFDSNGCGGAQTAAEASEYIAKFVERKHAERNHHGAGHGAIGEG